MGCCASKAFQPEPGSAKVDDASAQAGQRVGQQFEPTTPASNTQPPEQHLQMYTDPNVDPFRKGYGQSGSCAPPPTTGRRLSLDQRLQQQSNPNKANFVPSQGQPGRRLSLDQRLQNPQVRFVPSQGQRLSLDHILLDQRIESAQPLARTPYAYPSQGRRQSLDQRMESAPNDSIQRAPLRHSGPDARDPPSSQPCSRAKARAKGATARQKNLASTTTTTTTATGAARQKGRRSKQQVEHAYLNLDPECAHALSGQARLTGLLSPGPQFSLRGRLVSTRRARASGDNYGEHQQQRGTRVQQFVLAPEDGLQHLTWRKQRGLLEPLQPPSEINRDIFQGPMGSTVSAEMMGYVLLSLTSDSAEKALGISSVPKFPCINEPSLVEAEGAIKLCQCMGSGSGFDLRTSRDC